MAVTRARRLVADHAERHRQGLVALAGRKATDPDLRDHEVRPVDRPIEIGGGGQPHPRSGSLKDSPGDVGNERQAVGVEVGVTGVSVGLGLGVSVAVAGVTMAVWVWKKYAANVLTPAVRLANSSGV